MYKCLNPKKKKKFVIYPGTSADKLNNLISLNIGWGANFNVVLIQIKLA